MTITEFLTARLDEDETRISRPETRSGARAVGEVKAKRAILALHQTETTYCESRDDDFRPIKIPEVQCFVCGWASDVEGSACETLRLLAAVYRTHADYDPAWSADA